MKKKSRRDSIRTTMGVSAGIAAPWMWTRRAEPNARTIVDRRFTAPVLDPGAIPKFVDGLPTPGEPWPVLTGASHHIALKLVHCQVLPQSAAAFPKLQTPCWGYRTAADYVHTYLGPTIVGARRVTTEVTFDYRNIDPRRHVLRTGDPAIAGAESVIDRQTHGANRREPEARFIAHKHGNVGIDEKSDGYSESWVTPDGRTIATYDPGMPGKLAVPFEPGSEVERARIVHQYPNLASGCLAWYHDHALGITRLNVYAGMAGGFIVTDEVELDLIKKGALPALGGRFDVPLVIQDRAFYADGALAYPDQPAAGKCVAWPGGPSTLSEFFGTCMLVNGKTWPVFDVEPARYRLRFLNGCNSRFLKLAMDLGGTFELIGNEGGLLPAAVSMTGFLMGPAERFDVIFDFSPFAGKTLTLTNSGRTPYPNGSAPSPDASGVIMRFRVKPSLTGAAEITSALPSKINPEISPYEKRRDAAATRRVLLFEGMDEFGRMFPLLGHVSGDPATGLSAMPMMWSDPVTERSRAGSVEIWEIYNTTSDSHPIHLHDALFSVLDRQPISFSQPDASACDMRMKAFPVQVEGRARPSELYERGFKDTVLAHPGEVTRIVPDFTATKPGRFAWHCHILEHEDHEMMRPYDIVP